MLLLFCVVASAILNSFGVCGTETVGSGCVAQVYKAKIDGKLVAVKVVHPRVRQEIRADVEIMQAVTSFIEWWPRWQYLSMRESVDEFANLMTKQLNS